MKGNPWLAGVFVATALGYAGFVHEAVGVPFTYFIPQEWHPRGHGDVTLLDSLFGPRLATVSALVFPGLVLLALAVRTTRSTIASTVALAALGFALLCCSYGFVEERRAVWRFFGWRASAVMGLVSLVVAAALLAPFLVARWLEHGWRARSSLYIPVAVAILIALRDVTGTDPTLAFAISPWPIVPIVGLEHAALGAASIYGFLGLTLAVSGSWTRARLRPASKPLTICALLLAVPILLGQAAVASDYFETRNRRARVIIEAIEQFRLRETAYPDRLEDLSRAGDLEQIPRPRIGFGILDRPRFVYSNFGSSYLLEFSAPRWVQCAYSPAPAPGDAPTAVIPGDSWSCPQQAPALW